MPLREHLFVGFWNLMEFNSTTRYAQALYHHFLLFNTAITIMESNKFSANHLNYALELIKKFIQHEECLYGKTF